VEEGLTRGVTPPSELGLSWFINRQSPGINMIGHTGSQRGFVSDYCWLPEKKLFYALLCNIPQPIKEIRGKLFSILEGHSWAGNESK